MNKYSGNITADMIEEQMELDAMIYRKAMWDEENEIKGICEVCHKVVTNKQLINNAGACNSCIDKEHK